MSFSVQVISIYCLEFVNVELSAFLLSHTIALQKIRAAIIKSLTQGWKIAGVIKNAFVVSDTGSSKSVCFNLRSISDLPFFSSIEYLNTSPLPNQPNSYLVIQICLNTGSRKLKRGQSLLEAVLRKGICFAKTKFLFCFLSCESDYGNFRTPDGMWEDGCCLRNLF